MFQSFDIQHFRGFGKLRLDGVGRVNLVVGQNNSGKTSLLEAITLLANPSMIKSLPGLFRANAGAVDERFYRWLPQDGVEHAGALLGSTSLGGETRLVALKQGMALGSLPGAELESAWKNETHRLWHSKELTPLRVHAVSVQHRGPDSMIDAFAEAVRSPVDEKQMESLLASVDDRIRTVRLDAVQSKPFIVVDVGLSERVPLSQAGQGIYRLVGIFSELLGSKPNVCFIDEIENGIHYSALPKVWAGIAEVAARLDIQIFATTHSWECVVAAHEAFSARSTYDLRLVQLYRLPDGSSGRVLDRAHIEAAIAGTIEVR